MNIIQGLAKNIAVEPLLGIFGHIMTHRPIVRRFGLYFVHAVYFPYRSTEFFCMQAECQIIPPTAYFS